MTIFIKPNITPHEHYYIVAAFNERITLLHSVIYTSDLREALQFIKALYVCDDDKILFDGSVCPHTGVELANNADYDIFIYGRRRKGYSEEMDKGAINEIAAQAAWVKENMQYNEDMQSNNHYRRFMNELYDYYAADVKGNVAVAELMTAAARYLREWRLQGACS